MKKKCITPTVLAVLIFLTGCGDNLLDSDPNLAVEYGEKIIVGEFVVADLEARVTKYKDETQKFLEYQDNVLKKELEVYEAKYIEISTTNEEERMRVAKENSAKMATYNEVKEKEDNRVQELNAPILSQHKSEISAIKSKIQELHAQDQHELNQASTAISEVANSPKANALVPVLSGQIDLYKSFSSAQLRRELHHYEVPDVLFTSDFFIAESKSEYEAIGLYIPKVHSQSTYDAVYRELMELKSKNLNLNKPIYPPQPTQEVAKVLPMPVRPTNPYRDQTAQVTLHSEILAREANALTTLKRSAKDSGLNVNWHKAASYIADNVDYYESIIDSPVLKQDFLIQAMKK